MPVLVADIGTVHFFPAAAAAASRQVLLAMAAA